MEFIAMPPEKEMARLKAALSARKRALRRERQSKLLPFLQFVCHCLSTNYSYQDIADLLISAHGIKVHKTTIFRFAKKFPPLSSGVDITDADDSEGLR